MLGTLTLAAPAAGFFSDPLWELLTGLLVTGCLPHMRSDQASANGLV